MKIAIFCKDKKNGIKYLENKIGNMIYKDVASFYKYPRYEAKLTDGTEYIILPANDTMRGCKFDKAIVSKKVDRDFINIRIIPALLSDDAEIEYIDE
jgi:hypothetical protein